MASEFDAALLKGRQNYVCPLRLRRAMDQVGDLFTTSEREELMEIWKWAEATRDGTRSDLDFEPAHKVWLQVCSESLISAPSEPAGRVGIVFIRRQKSVR